MVDMELIMRFTSLSFMCLKISFVVVGPKAERRIAAFSCPDRSAYCTSGSKLAFSSATSNSYLSNLFMSVSCVDHIMDHLCCFTRILFYERDNFFSQHVPFNLLRVELV